MLVLKLRDYQDSMVINVRGSLRQYRNVLLQSPTGSGKTAIATFMLQNAKAKNKRAFFICHRKELIDQTAKTFDKFGLEYGFIAAGYPQNFYQKIQICSIDTLKNRLDRVPEPDLCIWDEAHHLGAAGWLKVHERYSKTKHIGLSATPERLDGKGLDIAFEKLVPGPQVEWLIENGFLAQYRLLSVPGVNRDEIATQMGDFKKADAEKAMKKPTITGDIISHWKKYASNRLTIGFAPTVKYSNYIVAEFNANGIPAAHIDANTDKSERRKMLRDLATGKLRVVFNVGLFGEGFDISANSGMDVTIGCVIDAAPTQSLSAWLQRCGRALRPQDEPAVILDHAGNWGKHGSPCEHREWTLEGREKGKKSASSSESDVKSKQCDKCYAAIDHPITAGEIELLIKEGRLQEGEASPGDDRCYCCGAVLEIKGRKIKEADGELIEINIREIKRQQAEEMKAVTEDLFKQPTFNDEIAKMREEKRQLQQQLFNLTRAGMTIGITPISLRDIQSMKPKQLREHISSLEFKIRSA